MKKLSQNDKKKAASFLGNTVGNLGMSMLFDFIGQLLVIAIIIGIIVCLFNC